ncbi:MAG: tripartite tricarboxylate transporter TctB family protein [Methyloligellaceae bacterium]
MLRLKQNPGIWVEWAVWVAVALIAYNITYVFDKPVEGYRYGATGWPRAILIAIMIGATCQLIFRYFQWEESALPESDAAAASLISRLWPPNWRLVAIFVLPIVYLWLLARTGFYLTTPFFIVAYLVALGVRSVKVFVSVTLVVYVLLLLIFTRLFYVALPVGSWQGFYDINNAIIVIVRTGL